MNTGIFDDVEDLVNFGDLNTHLYGDKEYITDFPLDLMSFAAGAIGNAGGVEHVEKEEESESRPLLGENALSVLNTLNEREEDYITSTGGLRPTKGPLILPARNEDEDEDEDDYEERRALKQKMLREAEEQDGYAHEEEDEEDEDDEDDEEGNILGKSGALEDIDSDHEEFENTSERKIQPDPIQIKKWFTRQDNMKKVLSHMIFKTRPTQPVHVGTVNLDAQLQALFINDESKKKKKYNLFLVLAIYYNIDSENNASDYLSKMQSGMAPQDFPLISSWPCLQALENSIDQLSKFITSNAKNYKVGYEGTALKYTKEVIYGENKTADDWAAVIALAEGDTDTDTIECDTLLPLAVCNGRKRYLDYMGNIVTHVGNMLDMAAVSASKQGPIRIGPTIQFAKTQKQLQDEKRIKKQKDRFTRFADIANSFQFFGPCSILLWFVIDSLGTLDQKRNNTPFLFLWNAAKIPGCKCYTYGSILANLVPFMTCDGPHHEDTYTAKKFVKYFSKHFYRLKQLKRLSPLDCVEKCHGKNYEIYFLSEDIIRKFKEIIRDKKRLRRKSQSRSRSRSRSHKPRRTTQQGKVPRKVPRSGLIRKAPRNSSGGKHSQLRLRTTY